MKKRFNSTGVCVPRKYYMVNIINKLKEIKELIDNGYLLIFNFNKNKEFKEEKLKINR